MPNIRENTTIERPEKKNGADAASLAELSKRLEPLVASLAKAKSLCLDDVANATAIAAEIGDILQEAEQLNLPGFNMRAWAEDHGLHATDATRYVTIAQRFKGKQLNDAPLRSALIALELLPETSGRSTPPEEQRSPTYQTHLNKLGQWFTVERVRVMDEWMRAAVIKQLQEIVERLRAQ